MWDLIKIVIPKVEAEWEDIAHSLRYDIATINAIEKNGKDCKDCCRKLFKDWLSSGRGATPKTWCTLLKKMKEVDALFSAVDDIKRELDEKFT